MCVVKRSRKEAAREFGEDAKQLKVGVSQKQDLILIMKKTRKSIKKKLCSEGYKAPEVNHFHESDDLLYCRTILSKL